MNAVTKALVTLQIATGRIIDTANRRRRQLADERGSLTLEQIIITVAIAGIAIVVVGIIVAAITSKAGEMPL